MEGSKGYYSLIQYCPDRSRLEVANVGVMLFCPELHFLKTRVAEGNDRIRKIFGVSGDDLARIEDMKQTIVERLQVESVSLPALQDVQQFIMTRGNDVILTPLRPMRVVNPEADLENLFKDLVGHRVRTSRGAEQSLIPELDEAMQSDRIKGKVFRSLRILLPLTERSLLIPYAFRNGKLNLIQPERFSDKKSELFQKASDLAFSGSLLAKHKDPESGIDRKLIVVSSFESSVRGILPRVDELFLEYGVRHIPVEDIGGLVEEIEQEAHA